MAFVLSLVKASGALIAVTGKFYLIGTGILLIIGIPSLALLEIESGRLCLRD